ncbi:MAG: hypothetical protein ACOH12_09915 [Parvibaculaceae bacterium]
MSTASMTSRRPAKKFSNPKAEEAFCVNEMRHLIRRIGLEKSSLIFDAARNLELKRHEVGRPKEFSPERLIDIWFFVKMGTQMQGVSVNKFCSRESFVWLEAGHGLLKESKSRGLPKKKTPPLPIAKSIKGATLRRRYQECLEMFSDEATIYTPDPFAQNSKPSSGMGPTEEWCKTELKRRLASQS